MPIPTVEKISLHTTAKDNVYTVLRQWIIEGTLQPGERLNDAELAKYFSISRTPVREALQMLSEQGLITIQPSSGTFVAPIDPADVRHVYHFLGELQAYALELVFPLLTPAVLADLQELNDRMIYCVGRGKAVEINAADSAFHQKLADLSGNPYLIRFTGQLLTQASRSEIQCFWTPVRAQESAVLHGQILAALSGKDLPAAQQLIRQNWELPANIFTNA